MARPPRRPIVDVEVRVPIGEVLALGEPDLLPLRGDAFDPLLLCEVCRGDAGAGAGAALLLRPLDRVVVDLETHAGDEPLLLLGASGGDRVTTPGGPGLRVAQRLQQLLPTEAVEGELDGARQQLLLPVGEVEGVGELELGAVHPEDGDHDAIAIVGLDRDPARDHAVHASRLADDELATELLTGRAALVVEAGVDVLDGIDLVEQEHLKLGAPVQLGRDVPLEEVADPDRLRRLAGEGHDQDALE